MSPTARASHCQMHMSNRATVMDGITQDSRHCCRCQTCTHVKGAGHLQHPASGKNHTGTCTHGTLVQVVIASGMIHTATALNGPAPDLTLVSRGPSPHAPCTAAAVVLVARHLTRELQDARGVHRVRCTTQPCHVFGLCACAWHAVSSQHPC